MIGLSVTYAVCTPRSRAVSVTAGCQSQTGYQPGMSGIPSVRLQARNGNERIPVTSVRRTGRAGMHSGTTRSKRSDLCASSLRLGVWVPDGPLNAFT
jgi:hypothetical protein